MNNCIKCNKKTKNNKFCSRSCSSSYNNKTKPKKNLTKTCKHEGCTNKIYSNRLYCQEHNPNKMTISDKTLGEVYHKGDSKINSHLRQNARSIFKKHHGYSECSACGYDKHIEVCHIKDIKDFPLDTKVSVINSPDNLIGLCPNCHWEFDNGLLHV